MRRCDRSCGGFTLVEVLVALSLLGITMATVVALFSSGRKLRAATRESLAFQHDARLLVETLRDDLANLVPSGPRPMITADSIVLWRWHEPLAEARLVTYQWSGSAEQDSLFVRVSMPLQLDPADAAGIETEFRSWSRIFDPFSTEAEPLVRRDHGLRFGERATLRGRSGSWVAFPRIRAAAWGICDDPEVDETASATTRLVIKLAPTPWRAIEPVPDPNLRLALIPGDGSAVEAGLWIPVGAQVPVLEEGQTEGGAS